jgi:hypothetical protein
MASPITGTVDYTAVINGIDASSRLGMGCVDASETYAYYPDTANRRIFRLDIAAGTFTSLYGNTFQVSGFPMKSLVFMPDGVTLAGTTDLITGTAYIYTFLADGTSGSPTQVGTITTNQLRRLHIDQSTGYMFVADGTSKQLLYTIPGTWGALQNYFAFFNRFVSDIKTARYDNDKILITATNSNSQYYICELSRRSGHARVIAGDGSTSVASTGSAYSTPVGAAVHIDSDGDGRVYFGTGSTVCSLIAGTIAQVLSANYNSAGGILFLPINNRLLVCNSVYEVRRVQ